MVKIYFFNKDTIIYIVTFIIYIIRKFDKEFHHVLRHER